MTQARGLGLLAGFALLLFVTTYLILTGSTPINASRPVVMLGLMIANWLTWFALVVWGVVAIARRLIFRR